MAGARAARECSVGTPHGSQDRRAIVGPRSDARGTPPTAARARHRRPPFRLATGDGAAGESSRMADRGGARRVPPAHRTLEGDGHYYRHCARGARHGESPPVTAVIVLAKSPSPGRVKTRLCPPYTPVQAADVAAAALEDTLAAVAASTAERRVLALDGELGAWL